MYYGAFELGKIDGDGLRHVNILDMSACGAILDWTNAATGMAAVQWAINKSLTQQGFTALEETIKTYICEDCQIPTDEELFRDTIVGSTVKFMGTRYNSAKKNQKKTNQNQGLLPDADSLKEGRGQELERDSEFMELKEQERAFYLQKVEELIDNLPVELVNLTSDIARYRNSLNHFGFQKEETKYTKLQDKLKELYEKTEMLMKMEQVVWEDSCLAAENPCDQ